MHRWLLAAPVLATLTAPLVTGAVLVVAHFVAHWSVTRLGGPA